MLSSMTDSTSIKVFEELLSGENGEAINDLIYSQYELVDSSMSWPQNKNEVVVITNKNNEISETFLYALGLLDRSELNDMMTGIPAANMSAMIPPPAGNTAIFWAKSSALYFPPTNTWAKILTATV